MTARNIREDLHDYNHIVEKYNEFKAAGDKAGQERARVWMDNLMEQIHEGGSWYKFIFRLYQERAERHNVYIVIDQLTSADSAKELVEALQQYGVEEFAFASTWSSAVAVGWAFTEAGCDCFGMTTVNGSSKVWREDRWEEVPAYLFRITNHAPSKED